MVVRQRYDQIGNCKLNGFILPVLLPGSALRRTLTELDIHIKDIFGVRAIRALNDFIAVWAYRHRAPNTFFCLSRGHLRSSLRCWLRQSPFQNLLLQAGNYLSITVRMVPSHYHDRKGLPRRKGIKVNSLPYNPVFSK